MNAPYPLSVTTVVLPFDKSKDHPIFCHLGVRFDKVIPNHQSRCKHRCHRMSRRFGMDYPPHCRPHIRVL